MGRHGFLCLETNETRAMRASLHRAPTSMRQNMPSSIYAVLIYLLTGIYGGFNIAFAFREPPESVRYLFTIPSIFIFFPDRYQIPVGRIVVGVSFIIMAIALPRAAFS
jgi:hypothetical protein